MNLYRTSSYARSTARLLRPAARPISAGLLAAALIAGSGCKATNQRHPQQSRLASAGPEIPKFPHELWGKVGYRLDWRGYPFQTEQEGAEITELRAWKDMIVTQQQTSAVALMEANTGAVRWLTGPASAVTRFVGVSRDQRDPNLILVASESELFGLAAPTGNLVSRERFEKVVNTRAVMAGPVAIFGCSTGEIQAHMIGRKMKAWGFKSTGAIEADPVRVGETIGVVSQAGEVIFMAPNGTLRGRNRVLAAVATNPVANDSLMFVAGLDQSVWAFDTSGVLRWRYRHDLPLRSQPTADGGTLYCDLPGKGLTAFEAESGKILWTAKGISGSVVAAREGRILVWDGKTASSLSADRGDVYESVEIPGVRFLRTDEFRDGHVFVVGSDGTVSKLSAR